MSQRREYDLYIDESGRFYENSYSPAELQLQSTLGGKKFPSQLAGVLSPVGELTDAAAEQLLKHCHAQAGWSLPPIVHMKNLVEEAKARGRTADFRKSYNLLIKALLSELQQRGWQPVLLVNREGVSYGNMIQTYTSMVAELFLRISREKRREGLKEVLINLFCSEVQLQLPTKRRMPLGFYEWRLRETQAMAAVRQGYAPESHNWKVGVVTVTNDDVSRSMQLCDVISHASHANFTWCDAETKALFKRLLGDYRWTMTILEQFDRVEQLVEERSLGVALITLAEMFILEGERDVLLKEARARVSLVLDELAEMVTPVRDTQLSVALGWLEQIITLQRNLGLGRRVSEFLRTKVEAGLRERLGGRADELDWFSYGLCRWSLTVFNHAGDILGARHEVVALERLLPSLAGHWEYFTLLTEGLIARSVHHTDSFEFGKASEEMSRISARYDGLSKMFSEVCPDLYPKDIHSDLRAKALGTWLQSEILAGPLDGDTLAHARSLSDAAINEFQDPYNKGRQWQYRCHLESLAGDFAAALDSLARSLGVAASHESVARAIWEMADEPVEQGFALMHWLCMGSASFSATDAGGLEARALLDASAKFNFAENPWCTGGQTYYPAHSILRRCAFISAATGQHEQALVKLGTLRGLTPPVVSNLGLIPILLAAQTEVCALLWDDRHASALKLLDSESDEEPGVIQLASLLGGHAGKLFPELKRVSSLFLSSVGDVLCPSADRDSAPNWQRRKLLKLGQCVRY